MHILYARVCHALLSAMSTSLQEGCSSSDSSLLCTSISSEVPSLPVDGLPTRKRDQERLLRICNTRFHDLLNLEVLFPHLVEEGLLTRREIERLHSLSQAFPDDDSKIVYLLKILPTKGKNALKRFMRCLHKTEDGTAHDELIRFMSEVCTLGEEAISDDASGSTAGIIILL